MLKSAPPIHVKVGNVTFGNDLPFVLIAGPDSLESFERTDAIVSRIYEYTQSLGISWVMKSCYDKSQRTSIGNWRGAGDPSLTAMERLENALPLYRRFKEKYGVPVTTDYATVEEAARMSEDVDLYQVQARLYRMTDILVAAGRYGRAVNIKRGHGESPDSLPGAIGKVTSTGNTNVIVTERGDKYGRDGIVVDMRLLDVYKQYGYPVCLDVSHPCQQPSIAGGKSGGDRRGSRPLALAGAAIGVAAIFMEVHDDPDNAPVDGPHSMRLDDLYPLLKELKAHDRIAKGY
ncbi:MAG: 3-deoxy-8-phosphooctulonate synthase [Patescibacteria group bacterium]|nr:MAG: 3-deoxy-8-phosphooctulonate synthase [Patescibacteria group bacterium]